MTPPSAAGAAAGLSIGLPAARHARPRRGRGWISLAVLVATAVYAFAPWLAPVFMHLGWERPARVVYLAYSTQCHQLASRSYFVFGPRSTYSVEELAAGGAEDGMVGLRAFQGSSELGWKVAWSDRMVAMYSSLFIFLALFRVSGGRFRRVPWWAFALLIVPLAVDGSTHLVSDLAGFGQGFRDDNAWLAWLTGNRLPALFYAGDAWGSFNASARLITGLLFGLGIAGLIDLYLPSIVHDPNSGFDRMHAPDAVGGTAYNGEARRGAEPHDAT